jgi:HD-GYP domain-containing protein (c-di-GMP phosphodiesterase class II)
MVDQDIGGTLEDIEEIEPLDELYELEPSREPGGEAFAAHHCAQVLMSSFDKNPSPMAILDDRLAFAYRNTPFKILLRSYGYPESVSFLGTIARTIDADTARDISDSLTRAERGYRWKGSISHRSKDAATIITRVHIQPLWTETGGDEPPAGYSVYFDDITEENKRNIRDMFSSLLGASKLKDNDTGKHIERVNHYSSRIARELFNDPRWPQVDKDFIDNISFLAAMHDVGKIGTPDDILNKEGPLNEFEWGIMKEHTKNGAFILSSYPDPMAKEICLSHHEWWNGSGYPYNLEGRMIPLAARIVSLGDVYDALRMRRSYKPAYPHKIAVFKIRQERGVHFDPDLVDVLLGMERELERIYEEFAD